RVHVAQAHGRSHGHDVLGDLALLDHACGGEPLLELRDPSLEHRLLVLRRVVFGILGDVAELAGDLDSLGYLATTGRRELLDLLPELRITLSRKDDVLQPNPSKRKMRGAPGAASGREW